MCSRRIIDIIGSFEEVIKISKFKLFLKFGVHREKHYSYRNETIYDEARILSFGTEK